jgi:hypothetical protein
MKSFNIIISVIILLVFISMVTPPDVSAIPAFARRYKVSCSTCHAPIPKLKDFGNEFAGNGFVIPEEEKERDYVTAGDDILWLNRTFPIAVRFDAYGVYDEEASIDNDLQIPWGVKLLSGGTLYKNIGYYFYFYLSERGEVAGIEDAYVHFNNIFNTEFDIMVGQFQTSDPLMKRELRLTYEDYVFYTKRIGNSGINLTYDRGIMVPFSLPRTGTDFVGFIVNGNGKGEADENRKFDNDRFKNAGLRISQAVGEIASLGGYVYYGRERQMVIVSDTSMIEKGYDNKVIYIGPDINITVSKFEFTGQYLYRTDTNPLFIDDPKEIKSNGYIAELIYAPQKDKSRTYFTALYNKVDSDNKVDNYETATVNVTYLLARNLRLLAEYTHDFEIKGNRLLVGFVSAF